MKYLFAGIFFIITIVSFSQKLPSVQILQDSIRSSFRGLSVPSDDVIWVSGSNGTVGRSVNGGTNWKWMIVHGFEKRDFRDIEAFDSATAIIMAVDNPADILKTTDGGKTWKVVFHKAQEGMFLDAMDCKNETTCVCIGDPITNFFTVLKSLSDGFLLILKNSRTGDVIGAAKDEALFAASGTNLKVLSQFSYAFVSGGSTSNLYVVNLKTFKKISIPIIQGKSSTGAFSMFAVDLRSFYITGGDYTEYWKDSGNVVYTTNSGKTWQRSSVHGYRSCIIQADKKTFITCGTNGVDISFDSCKTWQLIHGDGAKGIDGFNVCTKSKTGKMVYFAGNGRIAKLIPR
jgi:photosystem II stability/assembly factor-like uncharacterized protein